jgi:tetratricopeptide (TPR) repeat protein
MSSVVLLLVLAIQPFSLQNFFSIVGSVRDDTGRSVSSVRISLEDENGQPIKSLFADASGRFQFRGLRAGNYQVRVEPTGLPFDPAIVSVPLQSMTNSSINSSTTDIPTPVDIVLRRKKNVDAVAAPPAVVFSQNVPPNAREEFNRASTSIAKDPASGISSLKKAIEIFPEYFDALELLGTQLVKQGDFENAAPLLVRALAVNDKAATSMYALGVSYLKLKRYNESIEWLQHAASQDAGNPNVHLMLGQAYGFLNNLDQAESSLKMCYQLGGASSADAHLYLAGIYNKRERYGEAWKELELYLKEQKGLKDTTQIKEMISKLKEKEKAQGKK